MWASANHIFLPDFAQAVFFKPLEHRGRRTREDGLRTLSVHNDDILGVEIVEKRAGLSADEHLTVIRSHLDQRCGYAQRMRMQPVLRLINNDQTRQFFLGLEKRARSGKSRYSVRSES